MALDTFANLKTSIASHIVSGDVADQIEDFITLCEARNKQTLELPRGKSVAPVLLRDMLTKEPVTVSAQTLAFPDGFIQAESFRLTTDYITNLRQIDQDVMNDRIRVNTTGRPKFFSVNTTFEFDREPNVSYAGDLWYYKELDPLSDAAPTNALLTTAPNIYLYGSLSASAPFLLHDERLPLWEKLYIDARIGLEGALRRKQRAGPQVAALAGEVP